MDPMGSTRFARHSAEKSPGETVVARKELKFPAPLIGGFGDGWDSSKKDQGMGGTKSWIISALLVFSMAIFHLQIQH